MTDNTPREALDLAIGALADIAFSSDMSLEVARNKAKRIYEEARAALAAPVVESGAPTTVDLNLWKHHILPQGTEQPSSLHWDEPERRDVLPQPVAPGRFELTRSIIHACPAIKLPQSWAEQLGMTAQIVALKGADDAIAERIVHALNAAPLQQPQEGWVSVEERLPEVAPQDGMQFWLWKNGDHFLAFTHLYPCFTPGGDPMVLGEPVGRAVFKRSFDRAGGGVAAGQAYEQGAETAI